MGLFFCQIENFLQELRIKEIPAHQYLEINESLHFDIFKAMKQDPKLDLEKLDLLPKETGENPCLQLLEKETFHEVDELM